MRRKVWTAIAVVAGGAAAFAHVRLQNPGSGNPLFWAAPGSISIVINSTGSDDIPDGSHETSLRSAIRSWNDVDGSTVNLVEDTAPASQVRTDFAATDIHLMVFDESNTSGFFPGGSGIVAITPVWFFGSGVISDADILFNGGQFTFTTDASSGSMDVEDVAAHELGHLLGLDHSGNAGATMYPYVSGTVIAHRSLSLDEVGGMRTAYPAATFATVTGTVQRLADSSAVAGAWVVARDASGRTAGADLTDASGNFSIGALDAGTYEVYASPLDAPVSAGNLTAGHTIQTDFEPAVYGSTAVLGATSTVAMGILFVDANVALNLGIAGEALPVPGIADGMARSVSLRGSGLFNGSTLTVSDPSLTLTPTLWLGTQVNCTLTVPPGSPSGHVDVQVTNGSGDIAILPAAIEVMAPAPTVTTVAPAIGQSSGGTALTITGTGFKAGARVVIGDQIYVDGDMGGSTVVSPTSITLTTAATPQGMHDVVVVDPTGTEGRLVNGFSADVMPLLSTVFPIAGTSVGGTDVVLAGSNFQAGMVVRINGVNQPNVTLEGAGLVRVTTEAGVPGGPYVLEVENPGGSMSQSAFTYVAQVDPDLAAISPVSGLATGGETVRVMGSGFTANTTVEFDVDPETGAGGIPAASVVFIDANNLDIDTPAHAGGAVPVMVRDTTTGQAMVLAAGFTFSVPDSGGGGGCSTRDVDRPMGFRDALLGSAWLMLLAMYAGLRGRRPHPQRVQ